MSLTPYNQIELTGALLPFVVIVVIVVIGLLGWAVIKIISKIISIWLHEMERGEK